MENQKPYWILAYYLFTPLKNPHAEVKAHKTFFLERDVTCRIYLSEQGINGQLSAAIADAEAYIKWLKERPGFSETIFKVHPYHEHVFPRTTVKYRQELVAIDAAIDLGQQGEHVSPRQWKEMMEGERKFLHLDGRNDYEWDIGHFKNAERPPCETFRDFKQYATELANRYPSHKPPVMMSCTGGIRCELFSSLLKGQGFEEVYQLEGGIINYGLEMGGEHWLGKLFVFDDRLTVPLAKEHDIISRCSQCDSSSDDYYNCANMDCNHLFFCCRPCIDRLLGCCSERCQHQGRVRPYHQQDPHKPFRKKSHYPKID